MKKKKINVETEMRRLILKKNNFLNARLKPLAEIISCEKYKKEIETELIELKGEVTFPFAKHFRNQSISNSYNLKPK